MRTQGILLGVLLIAVAQAAATAAPATRQIRSNENASSQTNNIFPPDFVHGLLNLEFSDYHLTPRGIVLQNKGLVTQQYLRLDWDFYPLRRQTNQFINEAYLTTAVWNDIDTVPGGAVPGPWNEIDFIAGPGAKLFNDWTLESPFIAFKSETQSYPTCWAWDPRLTYHDHFAENFSINPYVEFFDEMKNKITVVLVPADSQSSFYFSLGVDPTYAFPALPLKLELPSYIIIPGKNFYQRQDGSGGGTDLALLATMFKVTVPLNFIRPSCGKWSVYTGVQYDYLNNPGLLDGNEIAGAAHSRERNIVVFHGGITLRF
jgi:hypothetical protein